MSQPKTAVEEVQHIPQLHRELPVCTVCFKGMRLSNGKHKPRRKEGCETCDAMHIACCWKRHLPRAEEVEE